MDKPTKFLVYLNFIACVAIMMIFIKTHTLLSFGISAALFLNGLVVLFEEIISAIKTKNKKLNDEDSL